MTASRNKKVDGIQWDSRRMSCRSNTVDKVVVDMPFGQRCGSFKSAANLIPKILSELSRVLRENGKAGKFIFLVFEGNSFENTHHIS